MNPVTLILGCGDVGSALALQLKAAGHRVIGARRHPEHLPEGIERLALDVLQPERLPDADILVYAVSADRFEAAAYRQAYPEGLEAVLSVLEQQKRPPRHVFFVSSTSVYDQKDGETVDEDSTTDPQSFSGKLMLEAEQRLLSSTLPGTVVRFSGLYGPGRERLIGQVREGRIAAATPVMYSNRIHRDDGANILAWLIERVLQDDDIAPLYLATDTTPAPLHDVMQWLAKALKVEPRQDIQSPLRRRASKQCRSARLEQEGYRFLYPSYKEGYRHILQHGVDTASP